MKTAIIGAGNMGGSIARDCDISAEEYRLAETGEFDISVSMLQKIARRYGIALDALMFGEEPKMSSYFLTRAGKGTSIERTKAYKYQSLAAGFMNRNADPFIVTVATMPWMQPKPGSMGLPNPQYDVDLIDYDGRSVEAGEQGQIVIRTDKGKPLGLFKEYYRDANRTHEAWHDNIYYTGDVAWKDEDGYLWFVGRADDVIKSSGYRIGPFEVESALMTHPAVIECAITGVPDEIRGQVVKATIVLSKEYKDRAGEELIKELQNHVKKVTAPYKYPRVIEFVDELPKTISGKIRRVEIRKNDEK